MARYMGRNMAPRARLHPALTTLLLLAGCSRPEPLPGPTAAQLRALAPAASVTVVVQPANPVRRIIQVDDLHWVSLEDFSADLQTLEPELTEEDIGAAYTDLMEQVEAVQVEQMALLRALAERHGIREIHREGLTESNTADFAGMVETAREFGPNLPTGGSPIDILIREEFADDQRRIGAAGRLLADGVLQAVLPADDAEELEAANPLQDDGTVKIDLAAQEAREAAIVRNLLADGRRVAVVTLGSAHDLSEHLPADCEYIRVAVPAVDD